MHEQQEEFATGRKARQQVVDLTTKLFSDKHWKVTGARWALADTERLASLNADQRRQLREAEQLNRKVERLFREGKYPDAVEFARQALEIRKQVQGKQHPSHTTSLNNLAEIYRAMGDYAKAEPMFRQALEIRKQVLGEQHPYYATSLNNLAVLYRTMGHYAQAEPRMRQALEISK